MSYQVSGSRLGKMIGLARAAKQLTQDELAATVGTSRTTIALLEQGRRLPDGELLETICRRLELAENFWLPARVRKLPAGMTAAVRCHCFTYYTAKGRVSDNKEDQRRQFSLAVKNGEPWHDRDATEWAATLLSASFSQLLVGRVFVPVPTSRKSSDVTDSSWAGLRIAKALAAAGSGCSVSRLIRRHTTIRKSSSISTDSAHERPSVQEHIDSLQLVDAQHLPLGIVLVDDVITRGTTMLACARLFREAEWPGEVEAIAIAYTRGRRDDEPGESRVFRYQWNGRDKYPTREELLW